MLIAAICCQKRRDREVDVGETLLYCVCVCTHALFVNFSCFLHQHYYSSFFLSADFLMALHAHVITISNQNLITITQLTLCYNAMMGFSCLKFPSTESESKNAISKPPFEWIIYMKCPWMTISNVASIKLNEDFFLLLQQKVR